MKKLIFGSMLLVLLFSAGNAQKCSSGKLSFEETHQCCNILETYVEPTVLSAARGSVKDPTGRSYPRALVEVFTNPEWIKKDLGLPETNQRKIIGCTANSHGFFSITGLEKGKYEIRVSVGSPWNTSHWYVRINPRAGRNKILAVDLTAGT